MFDAATVASVTAQDFRLGVTGVSEDEPALDTGFWLGVGWYSDKHEYVLCCDRTHSRFGAMVDGYASHPWVNGVQFAGCRRMADSFLAWLAGHARTVEPVTRSDPSRNAGRGG